jgi:hypothetical protein
MRPAKYSELIGGDLLSVGFVLLLLQSLPLSYRLWPGAGSVGIYPRLGRGRSVHHPTSPLPYLAGKVACGRMKTGFPPCRRNARGLTAETRTGFQPWQGPARKLSPVTPEDNSVPTYKTRRFWPFVAARSSCRAVA